MAEVASSAIGIISFGLTVCKGLYTYYHVYTSFDSSISSAYEAVAHIARTLILLKDSCNDPDLDRERKDRVAACVYSCEDALKKLDDKLQELRVADPEGFREKTRARFKRHAFPFKEQSLAELRNSAGEVQSRLALAVQVLDLAEGLKSQRVLKYLEDWSSGVTVTVDQISDDTRRLLSIARSDEIDKILQWLSPPDPWTNHHAARSLHQAGTGRWVLDNEIYKAWLNGSTRHLWLYGKAGCGKTILSSTMVEDVQHHCRQAVDFGFAPFYFTFSDKGKQSYESLLRSLVAQLGSGERGLAILRGKHDQRHKPRGGLNVQNLESILLALLPIYDTVFVILDALDECPDEANARSKLFDGLNYLVKEAGNLKILMTSRDVPDIRDFVASFPAVRLPIMTGAVDIDIQSYVAQRLSQSQYFRKLKRESLDLIQTTITEKADGMFRWAYCQLFELSQSKSTRPSRVEAVLRTLPATLDETYGRMLDRIGSTDRRDALVLLRWLAYAMRPLTLAELQAAVTIRPEDDDVDFGDEGDLGDSLSILSGLVVFSERVTASDSSIEVDEDASQHVMTAEVGDLDPDTHIRLAHFSVKEYLESTRISASSASLFRLEAGACHRFLSQSCLTYLAFYSKRDKTTSPKLDFFDFNLLNYAATKWYDHSRLQSGDDVSREVALLENIDVRFDWLRIDEIYSGGLGRVQYTIDNIPSMHYAVTCRLPLVVKELLKAGDDVNADWRFCGPLLVAATRGADEALIKVLLAHGANINKTTPDYENALYHAASRGLTLTKLLVDNGADVNLACDRGTALSAACEKGDQSVVRFLFERGARVDINGFRADTPLTIAASRGHKEILEFLIAKGADVDDVNSSADHGTTPLGAAAESGHTDIVAILIDAGADVSAKDNVALFEALRHGDERTVALLEARGAKKLTMEQLNAGLIRSCRSLYHKNPEKAVDLLLDRGADANAEDSSALLGALSCGHEDAVALLEAKGADRPTVQQLNDALIGVCEDRDSTGLERAIQMLLDRGTDVDAWDAALFITLRHGHEDAVALLEAKGANKPTLQQLNDALIELCKNPYCSDFERKIQMLLDRGADINAGDSVLISVLRHGNEDLVALLEAKGAKAPTVQQLHDLLVEARRGLYDDEFGTAVRMLLDRGALDSETSSDAELSSDAGTSSDAETS